MSAIAQELQKSAISPQVAELATEVLLDVEYDPITGEPVATPIADALGYNYTRFGHQVKAAQTAIVFKNENGTIWQLKIMGNHGKRSGKYLAPSACGDVPYIPPLPDSLIEDLRIEHGLKKGPASYQSNWDWIIDNPRIPVVVTEGAKKALALISQGIPAIAAFGHTCIVDRAGLEIKEAWQPYLRGRNQVLIAFDQDSKQSTRFKVQRSTEILSLALKRVKSTAFVLVWKFRDGKGIDDLICQSFAAFKSSLASPVLSLGYFRDRRNKIKADIEFNSRFVTDGVSISDLPDSARLIAVKSDRGTGKTEFFGKLAEAAHEDGRKVLALYHRTQLGGQGCPRLNISYIDDPSFNGALGFGLCVDSLHDQGKAKFTPEVAEGAIVVIDEIDQFIDHLLAGSTLKDKRAKILKNFEETLRRAHRVIVGSADLRPMDLAYLESLIGVKAFNIVNNHKIQRQHPLYSYTSATALLDQLMGTIGKGERVLIHCSAQKETSKFSTFNLEKLIKDQFPDRRVVRIDSETVANPDHPSYGCMQVLNDFLRDYDIAIASPTIETGVSIDIRGHFDSVFAFGGGVQTVQAFCQAIARLREDAPRHIWATKSAHIFTIGNGSVNPKELLTLESDYLNFTLSQLSLADVFGQSSGQNLNLETWAKITADKNQGFWNYQSLIHHELAKEGYKVIRAQVASNPALGDFLAQIRTESTIDLYTAISEAPNPSDNELKRLNDARKKTKAELITERKGLLCRRYLTEDISPELIGEDDDGLFGKLRLNYFLTLGRPFLEQHDRDRVIDHANHGGLSMVDLNKGLLTPKVKLLEILLNQLPTPTSNDGSLSGDDLIQWRKEAIKPRLKLIKDILGISLKKMAPMQCLAALLEKVGSNLELTTRNKRLKDGRRANFYKFGSILPADHHLDILERWLTRDQNNAQCLAEKMQEKTAFKPLHDAALGDGTPPPDLSRDTSPRGIPAEQVNFNFLADLEEILINLPTKKAITQLSTLISEGWTRSGLQKLANQLDPSGFFVWNLNTCWDKIAAI